MRHFLVFPNNASTFSPLFPSNSCPSSSRNGRHTTADQTAGMPNHTPASATGEEQLISYASWTPNQIRLSQDYTRSSIICRDFLPSFRAIQCFRDPAICIFPALKITGGRNFRHETFRLNYLKFLTIEGLSHLADLARRSYIYRSKN